MHEKTGKQIHLLGWSQGAGPLPRWALRWWPDTRDKVASLIGIAPDNRGTLVVQAFGCPARGPLEPVTSPLSDVANLQCAPAIWQQRLNSPFLQALNSQARTFENVNYTVIYTRTVVSRHSCVIFREDPLGSGVGQRVTFGPVTGGRCLRGRSRGWTRLGSVAEVGVVTVAARRGFPRALDKISRRAET